MTNSITCMNHNAIDNDMQIIICQHNLFAISNMFRVLASNILPSSRDCNFLQSRLENQIPGLTNFTFHLPKQPKPGSGIDMTVSLDISLDGEIDHSVTNLIYCTSLISAERSECYRADCSSERRDLAMMSNGEKGHDLRLQRQRLREPCNY